MVVNDLFYFFFIKNKKTAFNMEDWDLSVPDQPKKAPLVREKFTPAEDLIM